MKQRLQQKLQSQIGAVLPGYWVKCEFSPDHLINVSLRNQDTGESVRITGVTLASLIGPGALEAVVDELMFEIQAICVVEPTDELDP